jgi:hypothetical protein
MTKQWKRYSFSILRDGGFVNKSAPCEAVTGCVSAAQKPMSAKGLEADVRYLCDGLVGKTVGELYCPKSG